MVGWGGKKKSYKTCRFTQFIKWYNLCRHGGYIFILPCKGLNNVSGSPPSQHWWSSAYVVFTIWEISRHYTAGSSYIGFMVYTLRIKQAGFTLVNEFSHKASNIIMTFIIFFKILFLERQHTYQIYLKLTSRWQLCSAVKFFWFNVNILMHVFAQIIALLIVSGKCYRYSVMKDNLPFTINTATANGWGQTGMYNRPAKIS